MTAFRFFIIILIFLAAACAWLLLGGTIHWRTAELRTRLGEEVNLLWGPSSPKQFGPYLEVGGAAPGASRPVRSEVTVRFQHDHRYKGLLWFSTYTVDFAGTYTVQARAEQDGRRRFVCPLPGDVTLVNRSLALNGDPLEFDRWKTGNSLVVDLPDGDEPQTVSVGYRTRGRDRWTYVPGDEGAGQRVQIRDFTLTALTDFADIDYPTGTRSPSTPAVRAEVETLDAASGKTVTVQGRKAVWQIEDALTPDRFGIEMPAREDAGPVAGRMAFYAPVSLFFFFTVLFTVMVLKRIALHPMHYLFISAGFFAFHILLAYLVDKIELRFAFWISAAVAVLLVVSYMRLVAGVRFALTYVGLAQLVYLVGFSYAFFWTGWTGLTVVILAIVTLFVLMQATGRVDWNEVFRRPPAAIPAARPAPPIPPMPPPAAAQGGETARGPGGPATPQA